MADRKCRKCVFNENLQKKYPFLVLCKSAPDNYSEVNCSLCNSRFSVGHGGNTDIQEHLKSRKHQNGVTAVTSTPTVQET